MHTGDTLTELLLERGLVQQFLDAYELSVLWTRSIIPQAFRPPPELKDAIVPTDEGLRALAELPQRVPDVEPEEAHLALFCRLGHADLLVNVEETQTSHLGAVLSYLIFEDEIRYPYVFGRGLHDRARAIFGEVPPQLNEQQTDALLTQGPRGVFQVGHQTVGPFGHLDSRFFRQLAPSTSAPIAHCTEPSCRRTQAVALSTGDSRTARAFQAIGTILLEQHGAPSRWNAAWERLRDTRQEYFADFNPQGLVWLVGNALSLQELRRLIAQVVRSDEAGMRGVLPAKSPSGVELKGSADELVAGLTEPALMQLALLASDEALAAALDACVRDGRIDVPFSETRYAVHQPTQTGGFLRQRAELGHRGVRLSAASEVSASRLKRLIQGLFGLSDEAKEGGDLTWALLGVPGETVHERLDVLVRTSEPRDLVERFSLASLENFRSTEKYLRYGALEEPRDAQQRSKVLDQIVWKLGFDVPVDNPEDTQLRGEIERVTERIEECEFESPSGASIVRAESINLFVQTERFLESSLCFVAWVLYNDHYGEPTEDRFVYEESAARNCASRVLDGAPIGKDETLRIAKDGTTSLFGLVEGFRILSELLASLPSSSEDCKRPAAQVPPYAGLSGIRSMPLIHRIQALDLSSESRDAIVELLRSVHRELTVADVLGVRNRIPHSGREFPSKEQFQRMLVGVDTAFSSLAMAGALPRLWHFGGARTDAYRRNSVTLVDPEGRLHEVASDNALVGCGLPPPGHSQIVVPIAVVDGTSECLRFRLRDASPFAELWRGFSSRTTPETEGDSTSADGLQGEASLVGE